MTDTCVAPLSPLAPFVPLARHGGHDRAGALSAADLIARFSGGVTPPSGGRRARRAQSEQSAQSAQLSGAALFTSPTDGAAAAGFGTAPVPPAEPAVAEPATESFGAVAPPAGLTGSFFTGGAPGLGGIGGTVRSLTGAFPAQLRSPKAIAAVATVGAIGASAVLTGMPNPAQQATEAATGTVGLAAADLALPGLTDPTAPGADDSAPTTGADLAAQATQVLPAVPQEGPGAVGGSLQNVFGTTVGTLPQVLDHANQAQAGVVQKAAEAEERANALKRAAAAAASGAPVGDVVSGVSGLGAKALAAAQTKLGTPYAWGASGPNAFDCSGLTSWAFRQAGVTIPRTSAAQSTFGTPVAKGDLQPGDLVFFYQPVSHVGIYMGGGKILHASTSGEPVKISDMSSFPYAGARRI
ncbi:C40 family peptidase [Pseudonocardia xishanensis]|uniref:NlpC/P60 domain-containing protein n=1 Tax=Pseudonocardia xishanensis TaxID=630995 RepID=A0ABP8RYS5_9PSEU